MKTKPDLNHEAPDSFTNLLREAVNNEPLPATDPALREAVLKRLDQPAVAPALSPETASRRRTFFQRAGIALVSTAALALAAVIWQQQRGAVVGLNDPQAARNQAAVRAINERMRALSKDAPQHLQRLTANEPYEGQRPEDEVPGLSLSTQLARSDSGAVIDSVNETVEATTVQTPIIASSPQPTSTVGGLTGRSPYGNAPQSGSGVVSGPQTGPVTFKERNEGRLNQPAKMPQDSREVLPSGASSTPANKSMGAQGEPRAAGNVDWEKYQRAAEGAPKAAPGTTVAGKEVVKAGDDLAWREAKGEAKSLEVTREKLAKEENQLAVVDAFTARKARVVAEAIELRDAQAKGIEVPRQRIEEVEKRLKEVGEGREGFSFYFGLSRSDAGGEQYARIVENQFLNPNIVEYAQSTFAIDVDTASYANVRRFLTNGQLPPPDAVRLEEMVNYFKYKYPQPTGDEPFSVNTEMADCPWNPGHKLLRVGLQGKEIHRAERPASNLVFLIDTSGSMTDQNKLPLLKQAFTMLVGELGENDKVTMVTYAGNAGLRLPPTRGHEKETIIAAIDGLQSGGSTHGSAGIKLAYEIAAAQFIKGGTNKVILATDGDLNVGITDDAALVELITKQAETGVYLTVLGVGTGNLKDAKMERLADNGNGIYAYLDSVREARKVLVEEMSGSLVTIAKDVKIQLEFNPAQVASYRLLGYENRVMANQDFRNDAKDAGEIGAGHSVTAMYEIVMAGAAEAKTPEVKTPAGEPLRYQRVAEPEAPKRELTEAGKSGELLVVRLRYKTPEATKEDKAKEVEYPLTDKGGSFNSASKEFQFASAVVAFGLSLRNSEFRGSSNLSAVAEMAQPALGEDNGGHRAEFLDLVRRAKSLKGE